MTVAAQSPPDMTAAPRAAGSRGGPEAVFRAVANPATYAALRGYLVRQCRDTHLAEDLVQDVMVRAIEHARDFRGDGSVDGWLKAIARTTFLMAVRDRRESPAHEVDEEEPSAEDQAMERMSRSEAVQALGSLPEPDRELIDLYYGFGFSLHRIATLMATTECAVKCRLYRLRRRVAASAPVAQLRPERPATGATRGWLAETVG
jgi:RNA polymerase sigma-70 factor (ECF subfamily)